MWHVAQCSKTACSVDQTCELGHPKSHYFASYYDKVSKQKEKEKVED